MAGGGGRTSGAAGDPVSRSACGRETLYCVIPWDLADELHDLLREHWRDEPDVRVVVERRTAQRRRAERRAPEDGAHAPEARKVRHPEGRRIAERRSSTTVPSAAELPRRARRHRERLVFLRRVEPSGRRAEDIDTARLVLRVQQGDAGAFEPLYRRFFGRVYSYARVSLRDHHEAENVTQQVFASVLGALPRYEVRGESPFRAWLFSIARNEVLTTLRKSGRLQVEDPETLDRRLDRSTAPPPGDLDWLSDSDLVMLIERLPVNQRQVLALRFMLDLTNEESAAVLGCSPVAVRMLQHRALRTLEARFGAFRERAHGPRRSPIRRRPSRLPVLAHRRFALRPPSVPPARVAAPTAFRRRV